MLLLTIFAITAIVPDANAISGGVALTGALILLGYETLPIKGVGRNGRE